jgi:Transposase zinc-binding domain
MSSPPRLLALALNPPSRPCWYRPRKSFKSPLWRMVVDHFDTLVSGYDSRFRATHGRLRTDTENAFLSFQRCGDPNFGVVLFRCETCDVNLGVPFSCKSRICPSCLARKAEERSLQLSESVPEVDHRHIVVGFPKRMGLRQRIEEDPKLLRKLTRLVNQELSAHLVSCVSPHRKRREALKKAKPGIIVAQHTWADNLDYHPHLQCQIAVTGTRQNLTFKSLLLLLLLNFSECWTSGGCC